MGEQQDFFSDQAQKRDKPRRKSLDRPGSRGGRKKGPRPETWLASRVDYFLQLVELRQLQVGDFNKFFKELVQPECEKRFAYSDYQRMVLFLETKRDIYVVALSEDEFKHWGKEQK